jgi:hypothetical protein
MIKLAASCIWICLVTAATGYAVATWKFTRAEAEAKDHPAEKIQYEKLHPINVPMIADGVVQGYVVAQLGFTYVDGAPRDTVPPEVYLLDEAFQTIYSDPKLDFHRLQKYDVAGLTAALVQKTNQRLKGNIVKDVLVQELNFISKGEISK